MTLVCIHGRDIGECCCSGSIADGRLGLKRVVDKMEDASEVRGLIGVPIRVQSPIVAWRLALSLKC